MFINPIQKNTIQLTYTIYFFLAGFFCFGQQNVEFTKVNFPNDLDKLKQAKIDISEGDRYYQMSATLHPTALEHFLKAQEFNPNNAELNMKIGRCYLNSNQKLKALDHLKKAIQLNPAVDPDIDFYIGQAYQLHMEWDKAIAAYNNYMKEIPKSDEKNRKTVNKKISECNNGKKLMKNPLKAVVENLAVINTPFAEYGPVISADESVLIFTSRRDNTTGGGKDPNVNQFYEDIYMSNATGGNWETPQNLPEPVNTIGHDGAIGLSVDGQKLFVYVDDRGDGNIYVSQLKGSKWFAPEKLDKNINSIYRESSASFSPDEKTIYFVSNKPEDNLGDRDIFFSKIDEKGKWDKPVNIGHFINTEYGEEGVFMHPDGKTLFFSSQGHNSMGGYDIFMSVFDETSKTWSKPENLGYPLNTPDDDVFIVLSADSKHGYYTSIRAEGNGEKDIYRITFLEGIMNKNVSLVKGKVTDEKGNPIGAHILVKNKTTGETIGTFEANSATGKYLVSLPSGKNYQVEVSSEGYVSDTVPLDIAYKNEFQEIFKDITLQMEEEFYRQLVRFADSLYMAKELDAAKFKYQEAIRIKPDDFYVLDILAQINKKLSGEAECENFLSELAGWSGDLSDENVYGEFLSKYGNFSAEGLVFKIQVGAYRNPSGFQYAIFDDFGNIDSHNYEDGITRFTVGEFKTLNEALNLKRKARQRGGMDSFITFYCRGERKLLLEAIGNKFRQ